MTHSVHKSVQHNNLNDFWDASDHFKKNLKDKYLSVSCKLQLAIKKLKKKN